MSNTVEIELPSGKIVLVEAAMAEGAYRPLGPGDTIRRKMEEVAAQVRETFGELVEQLETLAPRKPSKITVELSAEISSGGVVKLFAADAKGGIKVSLTWETKA